MKVVNFFAGPSAGKSTMSLGLSHWMKERRLNVEYVPEYAKQLTWDNRPSALDDQLYVFAKQNHRLYQLLGQVDWVVTDSPLPLSLYYLHWGMGKFDPMDLKFWRKTFEYLVEDTFKKYDNVNFFVDRGNREFIQAGRNQDEEASKQIDVAVLDMLGHYSIPFTRVRSLMDVKDNLLGL
jgi:hypothetical protein